MTVRFMIHGKGFSKKPEGAEVGAIQNSIMNGSTTMDIKEFAQTMASGHTVIPALLEGKGTPKNAKFVSQQLWMFDIDNDDASVTVDTVLARCKEVGVNPFLIYETFSSTKEVKSFRVCLVSDVAVTDLTNRDSIVAGIIRGLSNGSIFVDEKCTNVGRLFYGGKGILYSNYEAVNTVEGLLAVASKFPGTAAPKKVSNVQERKVVDDEFTSRIRRNDATWLRRRLREVLPSEDPISIYKYNYLLGNQKVNVPQGQLYQWFDAFPMHLLLGVPKGAAFNCLIHDDSTPSAYVNEVDGKYRYKCFGCMKDGKALSLVGVIEAIQGRGIHNALKLLMAIFNITESEWVQDKKNELDNYYNYIDKGQLEEYYPTLYNELTKANALGHLKKYITMARGHLVDRTDSGVDEIIFFTSYGNISRSLRQDGVTVGVQDHSVKTKLNFIARLGLIEKLPDSEIPQNMLDRAKALQAAKEQRYRVSFFRIPTFSSDLFEEAERILTEEYKGKGIRRAHYCRETELMANGTQGANKVFVQDLERTLSGRTQEFYKKYKATARLMIATQGYATEKMILDKMRGYSKAEKISLSGKCLPALLQEFNLQRVQLNKKLVETHNIEGVAFGSKVIIPEE